MIAAYHGYVDFERVADNFAAKPAGMMFPEKVVAIREGRCATCDTPILCFDNALSAKEFTISGMCQACQDSVFGVEDDPK